MKNINPNNTWYENAFYGTMGGFASLWTPCTSDPTLGTFAIGYGGAGLANSWRNIPEWLKNPILYEFGQKTVTNSAFAGLARLTTVQRGAKLLRNSKFSATFNLFGNWGKTWRTGPTPAASLFLLGAGSALFFMGNEPDCGCE